MKTYAIILASGTSSRFEGSNKLLEKIGDKTVAQKAIEAFISNDKIDEVVVVTTKNMFDYFSGFDVKLVEGQKTRQESSYSGVLAIEDEQAKVLIHDCARPFVSRDIVYNCVDKLDTFDAVGVAIDCVDTIVQVENDILKAVPNRQNLKRIQTPQGFKLDVIKKAHRKAIENKFKGTDDCSLVLNAKLCDIKIIKGSESNKKITYLDDLAED